MTRLSKAATQAQDEPDAQPRPRAGYLWAMLLAQITDLMKARPPGPGMGLLGAPRMQVFPLLCTGCGKPMRIIAFVTEVGSVQRILESLGEPTTLPPIAWARGPPNWEADFDPRKGTNPALNDPLPEHEFDQRAS